MKNLKEYKYKVTTSSGVRFAKVNATSKLKASFLASMAEIEAGNYDHKLNFE